jgi:hypothetical protein
LAVFTIATEGAAAGAPGVAGTGVAVGVALGGGVGLGVSVKATGPAGAAWTGTWEARQATVRAVNVISSQSLRIGRLP